MRQKLLSVVNGSSNVMSGSGVALMRGTLTFYKKYFGDDYSV